MEVGVTVDKTFDAGAVLRNVPKKVKEYLHQAHVLVEIDGSDYIFNTARALFEGVYQFLTTGREGPVVARLRELGLLDEWILGPSVWNGKRAYVIQNTRLNIVMYRRSHNPNAPIMFSFLDVEFVTANRSPVGEKNTATIMKMWDSKDKVVLISLNFVGAPLRYREFLDRISAVLHRPVDWDREFESGRAKVRFVRAELYVRYNAAREKVVKKALRGLYSRWGIWMQFRENRHEEVVQSSVLYNGRVELLFDGLKMHVKSYRRKNYAHPPKTFDDHPKIEVTVYFDSSDSPEDVELKLKKAGTFLASFVFATHLEDALIIGWDTYPSLEFSPDFLTMKSVLTAELDVDEDVLLHLHLRLSELDKLILKRLASENLNSKKLRELAEELGVSVRTIQYHLRKLEDAGLVVKRRVRNNIWFYFLNFSLLRRLNSCEVDESDNTGNVEVDIPEMIRGDENLERIYLLLGAGYTTTKALSKVLGKSERTVRYHLARLRELGLVDYENVGRYVRWKPLLQQ